MESNYKKLGDYITKVEEKNTDLSVKTLLGVSMYKSFIPSVANTVGVDFSNYLIVRKNQFACKLMSVGRDAQLPVDLLKSYDSVLVSSAYHVQYYMYFHKVVIQYRVKLQVYFWKTTIYTTFYTIIYCK